MTATWPAKTDYATGDVLSAANMNAIGEELNDLYNNPPASTTNFYAGKNKIINGDFGIWQRGTSISLTNNTTAYTCDRFYIYTSFSAGTSSVSRQTFTPGTAPVSGYESEYFARFTAGSTATYFEFGQRIEGVQTFAGQTATVSFWAKASANTTVSGTLVQNFGSGGSGAVSTAAGSYSVTTSWQRFTATVSVPSISGKTIGTGNYLNLVFAANSLTGSQTIDFWGVQLEAGSTATPFQTATGTKQGELAACQRYYWKQGFNPSGNNTLYNYPYIATGYGISTTQIYAIVSLPVFMRAMPTAIDYPTITSFKYVTPSGSAQTASGSISLDTYGYTGYTSCPLIFTGSGLTANATYFITGNFVQNTYIGFSAEL